MRDAEKITPKNKNRVTNKGKPERDEEKKKWADSKFLAS